MGEEAAVKEKVKKAKPVAVEESSDGTEQIAFLKMLENMDETTSAFIVSDLIEQADYAYFALGGALTRINENGWYKMPDAAGVPKYANFKDYVEGMYGMKLRKALYLRSIYERIGNSGVPTDELLKLGWTKVRELSGIINESNYKEWIKKAAKMTVLQLRDAIQAAKEAAAEGQSTDPVPDAPSMTTLTLKVHADQKETIKLALEQAREEAGTDYDGVALEGICIAYMAGAHSPLKSVSPTSAAADVPALLKEMGPVAVLSLIEVLWPDVDITAEVPDTYMKAKAPEKIDGEL